MPDPIAPGPAEPAAPDPVPLIPLAARSLARAPVTRSNGLAAQQAWSARRPGRPRPENRPLPDARAIVTFQVPDVAPPYDDAAPAPGTSRLTRQRGRPASVGQIRSIASRPGPRPIEPGSEHSPARIAGPPAWPSQFAQILAETLAGSRPATQIVPWTTEQARRRIGQLGTMLGAAQRPRIRRVIVTSPTPGVLEMTVVVALGSHVHAVAVRLEHADSTASQPTETDIEPAIIRRRPAARWLCTAIEAA